MGYPKERKEAVLKKMLPPNNRPIPVIAREEGISEATLYNWRNAARAEGRLTAARWGQHTRRLELGRQVCRCTGDGSPERTGAGRVLPGAGPVSQPLSVQVHTLTYDNGKEFTHHIRATSSNPITH